MDSLQGQLLVASPYMAAAPFAQTVVLMLTHDQQGAMGVVLNRTANKTVKGLWEQISSQPCFSEALINLGGPVSGPLLAVHDQPPLAEMEVPSGLYVATTKQHLEQLVGEPTHPFRLFVGHSGWAAGQLEQELEAGAWHTVPATPELVFGEHDNLWRTALREVGHSFVKNVLQVKHVPASPSLN